MLFPVCTHVVDELWMVCIVMGRVLGCVQVLLAWLVHVCGAESSIGEWKRMCGVRCWRLVGSV